MKCPQCGAEVRLEGNASRTDCRYCGATVERPAPARSDPFGAMFEDRDGNGIPDIMEGMMKAGGSSNVSFTSSRTVNQKFIVNGVTYTSLDEMPPDVRRVFEGASSTFGGKLGGVSKPEPTVGTQPAAKRSSAALFVIIGAAMALIVAGLVAYLVSAR